MTTYLHFISADDARDGTKLGFAYAKSKRSDWISKNISDSDVGCVYITGIEHGQDFIVYNDKIYAPYKKYLNIDENYVLILCVENETGCETKVF